MFTRYAAVLLGRIWVVLLSVSVWAGPVAVSAGDTGGNVVAAPWTEAYAWRDQHTYRPPDFESYFPDSIVGARELEAWWGADDNARAGSAENLQIVRRGLRCYDGGRMPVLRWVGRTYILGKALQHPDAIELMYHATDCPVDFYDGEETRSAAIYFGLSVVAPKTDSILRTLVDLCMARNDPNDLSRIAWGVESQRDEALRFLTPYRESEVEALARKADDVGKILRRELRAFAWAEGRHRAHLELAYGDQLEFIAAVLRSGTVEARRSTLAVVESEGLALIMEDGQVGDFVRCATDPDPRVRARVARILGTRWIASVPVPDSKAIDLLLTLSEDGDPMVRRDAVYHGLTAIQRKEPEVLRRLLEMVFTTEDSELHARILWGFRGHQEDVRTLLERFMTQDGTGAKARDVYAELLGEVKY